jgi:hypothetical protein
MSTQHDQETKSTTGQTELKEYPPGIIIPTLCRASPRVGQEVLITQPADKPWLERLTPLSKL